MASSCLCLTLQMQQVYMGQELQKQQKIRRIDTKRQKVMKPHEIITNSLKFE